MNNIITISVYNFFSIIRIVIVLFVRFTLLKLNASRIIITLLRIDFFQLDSTCIHYEIFYSRHHLRSRHHCLLLFVHQHHQLHPTLDHCLRPFCCHPPFSHLPRFCRIINVSFEFGEYRLRAYIFEVFLAFDTFRIARISCLKNVWCMYFIIRLGRTL